MVALRASLAALLLVLAACSVGEVPLGGGGGGGDGGPDAGAGGGGSQAAAFDATIKPLLTSKGCISCHSGVQPPNFTSYTALEAKYRTPPAATNELITKAADGADHNGVTYFTVDEKTTVGAWIEGT